MEHFQNLQDRLNEIYSFPSAIIDNEGNILTATAWQDVCTQFHRKHPDCERECLKSDQYILSHLHEANPAVSYRCPHGLVDNATPIVIDGIHYGNFFTGQFFLEKPDMDFFRAQAQQYGFEEDAYLKAVEKVPIWSKEQLNSYLFFIKGLIAVISESGLKKLKETEARKQIEDSEERANIILRTAMDGFWMVDIQGRLLDVNDAYCRMSGYTREELLRMSVAELDVNESAEQIAKNIAQIKRSGGLRFERRHRHKDGDTFDVEISVNYMSASGGQIFCFLRDITKRKRIEESLWQNQAMLSRTESIAHVGSWEWDVATDTVTWSDEMFRIFQRNPSDGAPSFAEHPKYYDREDMQRLKVAVESAISNGTPYEIELRIIRKDGEIRVCLARGHAEIVPGKSALRLFGSLQDITERKRSETALRESRDMIVKITDQVPGVVYQYRLYPDGRSCFPFASSGMNDIYEVTPEEVREDATPVFGRLHPDDHDRIASSIHESARTIEPFHCEFRVVLPRQGLRWRLCDALPERMDDGGTLWYGIISDITDRRLTEEALRESEAHYRELVEGMPGIVYTYSTKRGGLYYSSNVMNLLGYSPEQLYAQPLLWHNSIHPDDRRRIEQVLRETAAGKPFRVEYRIRDAHSNWRWFDDISFGYKLDGPDVIIKGLVMDITERKRTEEALRESEQRHKIVVQTAMDGFLLADTQGRLLEVNASYCRMVGYNEQELLAMRISDLDAVESVGDTAARIHKIKAQGEDRFESRHRRKDGSVFDVEISVQHRPSEDGRLVAFLRDISERKRVETALRESEARLNEAQSIAHLGSWECDPLTNMLFWSDETYRIFEIGRRSAFASYDAFIEAIHPEDRDAVKEAYAHSLKTRIPYEITHRLLMTDGRINFLLEKCETHYSPEGVPIRSVGIVQDITERKRAEAEKAKLEAQFQQSQKMESVGLLAGGVAHDFNNILAVIMMQLGFLQRNPNQDTSTQESLAGLMEEVKRASNLPRQLLMFSRKSILDVKVLDLNEVIANLLKMLSRLIGEHITVQFEQNGGLSQVEADAGMMEQVVMNLALNARDAMPNGGLLTIRIRPVQIDTQRVKDKIGVQPGTFVCMTVADTGCGMDEATLKRIFEPFFTTKEVGKGTGLGLATVDGIVAQHKGWVDVESELGKGTTFKVFIPATTQGMAVPTTTEKMPVIRGHETILLVEDEAILRRLVAQGLRSLGYRVLEADNGQTAMKSWQEHGQQIDLLFSDMMMPEGLTGLDLAEKLRLEKPNLKVIISSGYNVETAGHGKPAAGDIVYFQKPYEFEELSKTIRDCLDGA
jgi:PAS domain S-box-containing protein